METVFGCAATAFDIGATRRKARLEAEGRGAGRVEEGEGN